jgi:hypothetical protein
MNAPDVIAIHIGGSVRVLPDLLEKTVGRRPRCLPI